MLVLGIQLDDFLLNNEAENENFQHVKNRIQRLSLSLNVCPLKGGKYEFKRNSSSITGRR